MKKQKLQAENSNGGSDRISTLPVELILHILSFMDTRDAVNTSILSNKWRYVWKSTPDLDLDFDLDHWRKLSNFQSQSLDFMNFVENVLNSRRNSNISKFRLYTYQFNFDFDLPRVSKWLIKVLACNVQHLVLNFPVGILDRENWSAFKLPLDLFEKNVRELEIYFSPDPLVLLPDICATSLIQKLNVHGVKLPEGSAEKEFILNCNVLEDLTIDNCDANHLKTITISTPLLERMHIGLYIKRGKRVKVKTYAKNLKALGFYGYLSQEECLVDFSIEDDISFLNSACICIGAERRIGVYLKEECYRCLMKILPRVCNARELDLKVCTKQVFTGVPLLLKRLLCQFHNVKYMKLSDELVSLSLHAILNFLQIFPHIETLVWTREPSRGRQYVEECIKNVAGQDPETNPSFQTMFTCLKTLEIVNLHGAKIELELLRFIFKRVVLLKEVIIKCESSLPDHMLAVLKRKLLAMHQVCPNALLTLLEKPPQGFW